MSQIPVNTVWNPGKYLFHFPVDTASFPSMPQDEKTVWNPGNITETYLFRFPVSRFRRLNVLIELDF